MYFANYYINIFFIGHFYLVQSWPILTDAFQIRIFCELFCPLLGYICSWHHQLWQRSDVKKYSKFAGLCVNNIVSQFVLRSCTSIFVPPFLNMNVLQFAGRCRYICKSSSSSLRYFFLFWRGSNLAQVVSYMYRILYLPKLMMIMWVEYYILWCM